jgi:alkanesulfonate monooxygenase SsuD/methylene tetrahydromethanopterin reductase-like flavin-dependent oxidoreductase (luciferase family)
VSEVARLADEAGFEALVPVARWKGFGGPTNFSGDSFETFTWAAGLGAQTSRCVPFATSHVPTIHPIVAAKQAATIDHITGGRFALNLVCGWFDEEFAMFGRPMMDHQTRYEYAAEWVEIVRLLWTSEDDFDFDGRYFRIERGLSAAQATAATSSAHHERRPVGHRQPVRREVRRHRVHVVLGERAHRRRRGC